MDKLPMTVTAWDKIHILVDMASNKMIQCPALQDDAA
jgi:hypothetical protein